MGEGEALDEAAAKARPADARAVPRSAESAASDTIADEHGGRWDAQAALEDQLRASLELAEGFELEGKAANLYGFTTQRAGMKKTKRIAGVARGEQTRLENDIRASQKEIQQLQEASRRVEAAGDATTALIVGKMADVRASTFREGSGHRWVRAAEAKADALKMQTDAMELRLRRAKVAAQREAERAPGTIQPFAQRRGKSLPGPKLGDGPMPLAALFSRHDEKMEKTLAKYYWDSHGRRHKRTGPPQRSSEMESAMDQMRRAARTAFEGALDLRAVFEAFDTNGNGILSIEEFGRSLRVLLPSITVPQMVALFRHFDPNHSGGVNYGEFLWAFFNRRGFVKRWKKANAVGGSTRTREQILSVFHANDTSGEGRLSLKEFGKALKELGIRGLPTGSVKTILQRFDTDGDGFLNAFEFTSYMRDEERRLAAGLKAPGTSDDADPDADPVPLPKATEQYRWRSRRAEDEDEDVDGGGGDRELARLREVADAEAFAEATLRRLQRKQDLLRERIGDAYFR